MANWTFDPSQYEERSFELIPPGDYRVQIADVVEKTFKSGNQGYEITLNVNGYNSKLWYYLTLDKSNPSRTNQSLGDFFNSFGITNYSLGTGKQWIGCAGAVRVKHEQFNGENQAKVAYCLAKDRQEKLPAWKGTPSGTRTAAPVEAKVEIPDDLPFDME